MRSSLIDDDLLNISEIQPQNMAEMNFHTGITAGGLDDFLDNVNFGPKINANVGRKLNEIEKDLSNVVTKV